MLRFGMGKNPVWTRSERVQCHISSNPRGLEAILFQRMQFWENFELWRPVEPKWSQTSKIYILATKLAPPVAKNIILEKIQSLLHFWSPIQRVCQNITASTQNRVFCAEKIDWILKMTSNLAKWHYFHEIWAFFDFYHKIYKNPKICEEIAYIHLLEEH